MLDEGLDKLEAAAAGERSGLADITALLPEFGTSYIPPPEATPIRTTTASTATEPGPTRTRKRRKRKVVEGGAAQGEGELGVVESGETSYEEMLRERGLIN